MSHVYHELYRTRLCRGDIPGCGSARFSLTTGKRLTSISMRIKSKQLRKRASELGIELFVLDDGWFGKRDNDNSSLGDWFVD